MRIKIRKADSEFSKYLREKRKWTCERCGRKEVGGMQASHFWGRKAESVRFDEENVDCLCFTCHNYFEMNPHEYVEFKKKRLGEQRYKMLMVRAHTTQKRDDTKILLWLKDLVCPN